MQSIFLNFVLSALACCCMILLSYGAWTLRNRRQSRRLQRERFAAYEALHGHIGPRTDQARFTYRPATRELVLDARAAGMHGLVAGDITVDGWDRLPATARVAGSIDRALCDALASRELVQCEYLARVIGQPDQHLVLTAVPLASGGMLVGAVIKRQRARSSWAGAFAGTVPRERIDALPAPMERAWLPAPRSASAS